MKNSTALVVVIFAVVALQTTQGRYLSRQKRVSDQRLAEIETLLALSKYRGLLSTVPVGFGRVDPNKLGRRRRAASRLWDLLDGDLEEEGDRVSDADADADASVDVDGTAKTRGENYTLVKDRRQLEPMSWGRNV